MSRSEVRQALLKAQVPHRGLSILDQGVSVQLASEQDVAAARKALADLLQTRSEGSANVLLFDQKVDGTRLILTLSPAALTDLATKAVGQSVSIVRRRIDETGVNEPVVARQGRDRILVELPGVSDPDRIKRLLGSTAKMTFRLRRAGRSTGRRRDRAAALRRERARDGTSCRPPAHRGRRRELDQGQRRARTPAPANGSSTSGSIASAPSASPMSARAMSVSRSPLCSTAR